MNQFILDTDTITLLKQGQARVSDRVLAQPVGSVVTSVITVDEQLSGAVPARAAPRRAVCVV